MSEPVVPSYLVQFGEFEADLRAGELFRQGKKIKIQARPFQVLSILLEHAGEVVTRDELRQRIWSANTFVDFDHGVAVAVNKVRYALRDSADKPRFVETVGGRGYRFLVATGSAGRPTSAGIDSPVLTAPELTGAMQANWQRTAFVGGALALLLALALLMLLRLQQPNATPPVAPHISAIAVLPLENLSNDPAQEYFVEGMTDEIITDLAKLPGLRVISRTSAVRYKNTRKTMPQIARELHVDGVVEGTVLRAGERVRIRVQLIDALHDQHLWAEAYERDLKDVLALQADVAQDIAGQIRLTLTSQQQAQLAASRPVNPEAHELYLMGRYFWNKRDKDGLTKAIDYFQQAIAKDPTYAAAYAGLADAYVLMGGNSFVPMADVLPRAKAAAERALELDSNLAEAHASLGLIAPYFGWDWADARKHYEQAIILNPNYASAHQWYAEGYLMPMGRTGEAIAEVRKAQELDPLSAVIATDLGKELYFARRYDEAIVELRRALELDPNFAAAHNWLSDTMLEKRMYPEAAAELEKIKPFVQERIYLRKTAYLYARTGRRAQTESALAKSLELSKGQQVNSGAMALIYAALGEKDEAFFWLEKAYTERSYFLTSLKFWTVFDALRSDPRYADLLHRVGLPQ